MQIISTTENLKKNSAVFLYFYRRINIRMLIIYLSLCKSKLEEGLIENFSMYFEVIRRNLISKNKISILNLYYKYKAFT